MRVDSTPQMEILSVSYTRYFVRLNHKETMITRFFLTPQFTKTHKAMSENIHKMMGDSKEEGFQHCALSLVT